MASMKEVVTTVMFSTIERFLLRGCLSSLEGIKIDK